MTSTTKDGQKGMINNGLISTRLSRQATSMMKMANVYWNSLKCTNLKTSLTALTTNLTTSLITVLTTSPITAPTTSPTTALTMALITTPTTSPITGLTTSPTTQVVTSMSCHHLRVALLTWLSRKRQELACLWSACS